MYKTTVILKKGQGRTLKAGGLWVFDNEIAKIDGEFENGDIVAVLDFDGYFMGYGFINTNSKITQQAPNSPSSSQMIEKIISF